jgi:hypothetical protein
MHADLAAAILSSDLVKRDTNKPPCANYNALMIEIGYAVCLISSSFTLVLDFRSFVLVLFHSCLFVSFVFSLASNVVYYFLIQSFSILGGEGTL